MSIESYREWRERIESEFARLRARVTSLEEQLHDEQLRRYLAEGPPRQVDVDRLLGELHKSGIYP